jgi:hypothetical protein
MIRSGMGVGEALIPNRNGSLAGIEKVHNWKTTRNQGDAPRFQANPE